MKKILLLGAGLSATSLIKYFLDHSINEGWHLDIIDSNIDTALAKIDGHPSGTAYQMDALDAAARKPYIEQADLVISMLPAQFHVEVAQDCIALKKHLLTPSYISASMRSLDAAAKAADVLLMNEIGLDPGIDHMSAMRLIDSIKQEGGKLLSFKSYCGGLISPDADNNPWHYKFTWNPRNVVLAGQGPAACYREMNELKYVTYQRLFKQLDNIHIDGYGNFEGYANRDSLSYLHTYGIEDIPTIFRGTLRRPPFCKAWDVFVQLGMTEDHFVISSSAQLTPRQFLNAFLPYKEGASVEEKFRTFIEEKQDLFELFQYLGLFESKQAIGIENASPAMLLQKILIEKWTLGPKDKDMIVMYHDFIYELNSTKYKVESSLVLEGKDQKYTAMSDTVGLPLAICAKLILKGQIKQRGVCLPIQKEVYEPILNELGQLGINFTEKQTSL